MKTPQAVTSGAIHNDNFLSVSDEAKKVKLSEISAPAEDTFLEYFSLSDYERQCLPSTNYWREKNGLPIIAVPDTDLHYYTYFKASVNDFKGKTAYTSNSTEIVQQSTEKALTDLPNFSFYKKPIFNLTPYKNINLVELYKIIITPKYYKSITEQANIYYKQNGKKDPYYSYKITAFDYVSFSGTFPTRNDDNLISHSGYYCLDVDCVEDAEKLKQTVISLNDRYFETELCFISPSGYGIKWIVSIDCDEIHKTTFEGLKAYISETYNISIDDTPDVSRACFICHDANCFINTKYL